MFKLVFCGALTLFGAAQVLVAQVPIGQTPARPAITGISHMCVFSHDLQAADDFYGRDLGARKAADPEEKQGVRYYFSAAQFAEVLPLPPDHGPSRVACIAFNTADAEALRTYLRARGSAPDDLQTLADGSRVFHVNDPEGNRVEFVQPPVKPSISLPASTISTRIIHVGLAVRSKAVEDGFYHQILGFRPYWFGGPKPGNVDWISQQVPDGTDWLEYMMVGGNSTRTSAEDQNTLGVLNHFSLGVANMEAAVTLLLKEDRMSSNHNGPQMGHDGKWQANLYDPDGTRVELMEFQPSIKPCCSPFTAESPTR